MDFIDGLHVSKHFDCLLVVVDKLTKYTHFIPLKHPYMASKVAEAFVENIYRLHGMPLSLVSDRDPVFTSNFWQAAFRATGTQLKLSTANHPEMDSQTERANQSIECYLRCFISAHPKTGPSGFRCVSSGTIRTGIHQLGSHRVSSSMVDSQGTLVLPLLTV